LALLIHHNSYNMKKLLLVLTTAFLLTAASAMAAITSVSLSFNDTVGTPNSGTYNSGTFTFDLQVSLTFTADASAPNMLKGLSYWLETQMAAASHITITSEDYSTWTLAIQPDFPKVFTDSSGAHSGFLSDMGTAANGNLSGDLGATSANSTQNQSAGMFQVSTLHFSVSGLAPGTYTLMTTTLTPKISEATDNAVVPQDHPFSAATYTFTVVPEPATWVTMGLGAAMLLAIGRFRRPRA
jgi:hypothetical protein